MLKALNSSDLRLFPGQNSIDVKTAEELKPYFKSKAAKSLLKDHLTIGLFDELDADEKVEAEAAREKNDMLNRSGLTIKKQEQEILAKDEQLEEQAKKIEEQNQQIAQLLEGHRQLKNAMSEAGIEV